MFQMDLQKAERFIDDRRVQEAEEICESVLAQRPDHVRALRLMAEIRLRARQLLARTVTVKIRDDSFGTVTRSRSMVAPSSSTQTLYRLARALFERWRSDHRSTAVRLLGMGVSGLEDDPRGGHELGDSADSLSARRIDAVVDRINERFGGNRVVHGQTLRRKR